MLNSDKKFKNLIESARRMLSGENQQTPLNESKTQIYEMQLFQKIAQTIEGFNKQEFEEFEELCETYVYEHMSSLNEQPVIPMPPGEESINPFSPAVQAAINAAMAAYKTCLSSGGAAAACMRALLVALLDIGLTIAEIAKTIGMRIAAVMALLVLYKIIRKSPTKPDPPGWLPWLVPPTRPTDPDQGPVWANFSQSQGGQDSGGGNQDSGP